MRECSKFLELKEEKVEEIILIFPRKQSHSSPDLCGCKEGIYSLMQTALACVLMEQSDIR